MKTTNLKFYDSSLVSLIIIHEETKKSFICIKIQTIVNRKNMRFLDENRQFTPNREQCKAYTSIFKTFWIYHSFCKGHSWTNNYFCHLNVEIKYLKMTKYGHFWVKISSSRLTGGSCKTYKRSINILKSSTVCLRVIHEHSINFFVSKFKIRPLKMAKYGYF